MELSCFEMNKMEAILEVSVMELYYSAKTAFHQRLLCILRYSPGDIPTVALKKELK